MAKVKIQGHASGTGILTVTAPNTSTDRTITLPDADVTLGAATPSITDSGNATAITIDSAENVGIGTAPKTTGSTYTGVNIGGTGLLLGYKTQEGGADIAWANNMYFTTNYYRMFNEETSALYQANGTFIFKVAAAGAADSVITWTDALTIKNDGRGLSQFTAKAWINFNGTGTIATRDSHNVSSIADSGTGNYQVNLTNAMANTNYCVTSSNADWNATAAAYPNTTSQIQVWIENSNANADTSTVEALVFGD